MDYNYCYTVIVVGIIIRTGILFVSCQKNFLMDGIHVEDQNHYQKHTLGCLS